MDETDKRTIGCAIDHLLRGKKMCRKGHNVLASMEIEQAMGYLGLLNYAQVHRKP